MNKTAIQHCTVIDNLAIDIQHKAGGNLQQEMVSWLLPSALY